MLDLRPDSGFDSTPDTPRATAAAWCRVLVDRPDHLEIRPFLRHGSVLYPWPLKDWSTDGFVDVFLEAPGRYELAVEWRDGADAGAATGWARLSFVVEPTDVSLQPTRGRSRGGRFWAPNAFEAAMVRRHEDRALGSLSRLVPPGGVVYDVGANLGLWSVAAGRAVGASGRVVSIEPNPLCLPFLAANLELAEVEDRTTVLPLALSDGRAERVDLHVNYANSHLSTGAHSMIGVGKPGTLVSVPAASLDSIVATYDLPDPDLVKLDVEGAEASILPGCGATLERARPVLVIEVHGLDQARHVAPALEALGYRFEDVTSDEAFEGAKDLLERFGPGVRQLLCRWRSAEPD